MRLPLSILLSLLLCGTVRASKTLYVATGINTDGTFQLHTANNWGSKPYHPGTTPAALLSADTRRVMMAEIQRGIDDAGIDLKLAEWHGETPVLGQSFIAVVGGSLDWAAPDFPPGSTSGLHYRGSFSTNSSKADGIAYSTEKYFGGDPIMTGRSVLFEAVGGAGGLAEAIVGNQWVPGRYMGQFTQLEAGRDRPYWTDAEESFLQAVYGKAAPVPEPSLGGFSMGAVMAWLFGRRG
jgi:hypothetical protein